MNTPNRTNRDAVVVLEEILRLQQQTLQATKKSRDGANRTAENTGQTARLISQTAVWTLIAGFALYTVSVELYTKVADSRIGGMLGLGAAAASDGRGGVMGGEYASPLVGTSLADLVDYQPSHRQSFGPKTSNDRDYGPHGGVDFDCRVGGCAGAQVAAPISGKVTEVERLAFSVNGGSYRVKISGNDWNGPVVHRLVHIDSLTVKVGDTVSAGQVVGQVSPTDSLSSGPHLDWKIQQDGQWIDPQEWAAKAQQMAGSTAIASNLDPVVLGFLAKQEGGIHTTAYFDGYADGSNRYSIGLGTIAQAGETITPGEAKQRAVDYLNRNCAPLIEPLGLSINQQAAIYSFCYNMGPDQFKTDPDGSPNDVYQALLTGDTGGACLALDDYTSGGILNNRRNAEQEIMGCG